MANYHLTLPSLSLQQLERFWRRVTVSDEHSCWNWRGCINNQGYGKLTVSKRLVYAHRLAYFLTFEHAPQNMCVLHHCDNPLCCNPNHLFLGTIRDNSRDMVMKGRHGRIKLTVSDVLSIRERFAHGETNIRALSLEFNVTPPAVRSIIKREHWTHI